MKTLATALFSAIFTAVVVSAFWIWFYNVFPGAGAGGVAKGQTVTIEEGLEVGPGGLAIPVAGIKPGQLVDTFTQARAGGGRRHDAIDIMAPAGTPVLAAAPGTVEKLYFSHNGGGISAYVRSSDRRWIYYFAHLEGYAPGLGEGQRVARGQIIGLVGSTGNANPAGPHLHFAIQRVNPGEKWYQGGAAVNPYPLLAGKRASG